MREHRDHRRWDKGLQPLVGPRHRALVAKGLQPLVFMGVVAAMIAILGGGCGPATGSSPERHGVITFAPSITETVFALGEGSRVAGVTDYCKWPPEARELPRVGDVLNPNLERIVTLSPELIILPGPSSTAKVAQLAERLGIPIVNGYMDSLATIDEGIARIGEALGCAEAAIALRERIRTELDTVAAAVADRTPVSVLLVPSRDSHSLDTVFSVGAPSFLAELIEIAGGRHLLADYAQPYVEVSKETITVRAPDVIIEIHAGAPLPPGDSERYRNDWNALPTLPAVRSGRVYILTDDFLLIPGPRVPAIARRFAECLHPDIQWPPS